MIHKKLWEYWLKFGRVLGKIQTTIILSIIYYLVLSPIGIFKQVFSFKKKINSFWIDIPKQKHDLEESYQQY